MQIKELYTVKSIDTFQCKDWLMHKHYAKRMPSITYSFGLFNNNKILQGVCTFGFPMASQLQNAVNGLFSVIELNRLVTNDDLPKNTTSFFVSSCLKMIPKPMAVVSYADSEKGHHGFIYQATNWIYTGIGSGGWGWAVKGLENMHHTSIEDSVGRYENRSTDSSLEKLLKDKYGERLYKKKESEKYRYFYFCGNKKDTKLFNQNLKYPKLPYPKGDNVRYDASYNPVIQSQLF